MAPLRELKIENDKLEFQRNHITNLLTVKITHAFFEREKFPIDIQGITSLFCLLSHYLNYTV